MGEGVLQPGRRPGPDPDGELARKLLDRLWPTSGVAAGFRRPLAVPDDPEHRGVSAEASRSTEHGRRPDARSPRTCPSRLRADQIFEALTHALDLEPRARRRNGPTRRRARPPTRWPGPRVGPGGPPRKLRSRPSAIDPSTPNEDVVGTIPQALLPDERTARQVARSTPGPAVDARLPVDDPPRQPGSVLDLLYLRALGRRPNREGGRGVARDYLQGVGNRAEAFEDILWALHQLDRIPQSAVISIRNGG